MTDKEKRRFKQFHMRQVMNAYVAGKEDARTIYFIAGSFVGCAITYLVKFFY